MDSDFNNPNHVQAIANTAAFHFGYIEQGGSSLYASLAQKARHPDVLKIILGIGGDEIAHFLEWVDFAGNAVQRPPFSFAGRIGAPRCDADGESLKYKRETTRLSISH